MALASLNVIGPLLGVALSPPDPIPAGAAWSGVGGAIGAWAPGAVLVLPGTMTAAGAAVTGRGVFSVVGDTAELGRAMATGAGSTDPDGIARWTTIAERFAFWLETFGQANPSAFVANPAGGPVTGTGTIEFSNMGFGADVASALAVSDPAGVAAWTSVVGPTLLAQVIFLGQVLATPIGFASPGGGGPLTGSGTII